jgi:hypothetical protein
MKEVYFRCGIQRKKLSSIVGGYNGRGFFPLWDTMKKKNLQRRLIFLNFKGLLLPSNKNLGKIGYLNGQTNPWKELKMENYMVNHEKILFSQCGIHRRRDFLNFLT